MTAKSTKLSKQLAKQLAKRAYFDYAAATPLDADVSAAMHQLEKMVGNPSSLHAEGQQIRQHMDQARATIAQTLAVNPDEIVFTSGATEADNLAVFGTVTASGNRQAEMITIATEHHGVRSACQVIEASGYRVHNVRLRPSKSGGSGGLVDVSQLAELINDQTVLVTMALANSETGVIQPIAEIGKIIAKVKAERAKSGNQWPLNFHTDASAAAGWLPLMVDRLGVDLMTVSSAKLYGPAGAGLLYVRRETPLTPIIIGGGQERSRRAGTENVPAIVGFASAMVKAEAIRKSESRRISQLRDELWSRLKDIPEIIRNGDIQHCLPNILNISLPGQDGESLVLKLDAAGFAVATGAACAESAHQPSHVLLALGLTEAEAQSSLRISLGRPTTSAQINALAKAIHAIIQSS